MIQVTDKYKCCGCSACASACPKECIVMKEDFEGFQYPVVDAEKCINCGLCESVCPVINPPKVSNGERKLYAVRTKKQDILFSSTSGGFFTPLAECIAEKKGIICAAAYTDEFTVKHIILDCSKCTDLDSELKKYRGSKYVQSDITNCYSKVKEYLKDDRIVCFVGTPCQVSGLKNFLQKEYKNLISVDLVCHGVPSPKLWRRYLEYQEEKHQAKITSVNFRSKRFGYKSGGVMEISFEGSTNYFASAKVDIMLKCFFNEIVSRPICYQCPFKKLEHSSDFTIYDCWNVTKFVEGIKDDDKGWTNLIVQSSKGELLLKEVYGILAHEMKIKDAIPAGGKMLVNCAIPHPKRNQFFYEFDKHTLTEHMDLFLPIRLKDYLMEKLRGVLYHLGLLNKIKKLKFYIKRYIRLF